MPSLKLPWDYRVYFSIKQVRKYSRRLRPYSTRDLALRLWVWRACLVHPPGSKQSPYEQELRRIGDEFHQRQQKAQSRGDADDLKFLRRIIDASELLAKGDFFQKLSIESKTEFVFDLLEKRRGKPPLPAQVLKELENAQLVRSTTSRARATKAATALYRSKLEVK